jgi:cobalt-zinc-cadmium resistance protein CzcA
MATGVGSDVQRSLATVVAGGLLMATLLTLFLIPTYYFVMERVFHRREASDEAPESEEMLPGT